jgi:hypothetical protein
MDEKTKDFIGEKREVKLGNGMVVTVTTPTLGWWYDFFIPKTREMQMVKISPKQQKDIIDNFKDGKLATKTLMNMPVPIAETLLELVVYYVKKDATWCKENMDINDFLAVINAFLEVMDIKRTMDFFERITEQVPVEMLAAMRSPALVS